MDVTLMKTPWPHTDVTVDVRDEDCARPCYVGITMWRFWMNMPY